MGPRYFDIPTFLCITLIWTVTLVPAYFAIRWVWRHVK